MAIGRPSGGLERDFVKCSSGGSADDFERAGDMSAHLHVYSDVMSLDHSRTASHIEHDIEHDIENEHDIDIDNGAAFDCDVRIIDRDKVIATRRRVPSIAETDQLAEWFRALGDPTRARILYALLEAGELCVCDLAATIDVSETSVSHALRWLRASGAVRSRRAGRMIHYSLDDGHVRLLLDLGREHLRHNRRDETARSR